MEDDPKRLKSKHRNTSAVGNSGPPTTRVKTSKRDISPEGEPFEDSEEKGLFENHGGRPMSNQELQMRNVIYKMKKTRVGRDTINAVEHLEKNAEARRADVESTVDKYQRAKQSLEENFYPEKLACREKEKEILRRYIESGIESNGRNDTLYVSGMPGIGKTACVIEVAGALQKNPDVPPFNFLYINAQKLKASKSFYQEFFAGMTKVRSRLSTEQCKFLLDEYFRKGRFLTHPQADRSPKLKNPLLLVVDEMDFLYTNDQEVLYNLFNWNQSNHSKMIIIGISNTLDLPESLHPRVASRMGRQRLAFAPYNSQAIQQILEQRLKSLDVFASEAITYISKKIATVSSDIRKVLKICKLSIEAFLNKKREAEKYGELTAVEDQALKNLVKQEKIPVAFVIKTFDDMYKSQLTSLVAQANSTTKLFLSCLYVNSKLAEGRPLALAPLLERWRTQSDIVEGNKFSIHEGMIILRKIQELGIVKVKFSSGYVNPSRFHSQALEKSSSGSGGTAGASSKTKKLVSSKTGGEVVLLMSPDELHYPLRDEEVFKRISGAGIL